MAKGNRTPLQWPLLPSQTMQIPLSYTRIDQKVAVLLVIDDISQTYPHIHRTNRDTR